MLSDPQIADWIGLIALATAPVLVGGMVTLRVVLRLIAMIREQQAAILSLSEKPSAQALAMTMERSIRVDQASDNGATVHRGMRPIA